MRLVTGLIIIAVSVLLFYAFGLVGDSVFAQWLGIMINPGDGWKVDLIGLALAGIAVVATNTMISGLAAFRMDMAVTYALAAMFLTSAYVYVTIGFNLAAAINPLFGGLIISPFLIVWVVTVIDWWRGTNWS